MEERLPIHFGCEERFQLVVIEVLSIQKGFVGKAHKVKRPYRYQVRKQLILLF